MDKELPEGWKVVVLGKECDKISLNGIKIKQKDYLANGKYPVVDQGQPLVGGYYDNEDLVVPGKPPYIIFGDHTKVKKFINFNFIAGADGVKVLQPSAEYDPKFFYYLLHVVKIEDKGYARHFQFLEKAEIPKPPIQEQHQIVEKIEELFSELDKGIENLKTAQQQLKVYRQAVLKWAFEGKLTNENVKDGELPEGWGWSKIGLLSPKVTVGYVGSMKDEYVDGGIPFLRGQNVRTNRYDPAGLKYISSEFNEEIKKSKIYPGDILVVRSGNVGTACVVPESLQEANCSDLVIIRKPYTTNSYFVAYYLNSVIQSRILSQKVGVALGHFNTKTVEKFEIPVPEDKEQRRIVEEIESRLSVCDKMEETINTSLQQAEALRQSILKRAFEGKLVKTK